MIASRVVPAVAFCCILSLATNPARAGEPGELTIHGKVLLADGSPAAEATIEQQGVNQTSLTQVTTDAEGHFKMTDRFERGVNLQVRSADDREQALFNLPAAIARTESRKPILLKLTPAKPHSVHVTRDGTPVADAEVLLAGFDFVANGETDRDGKAMLLLPSTSAPVNVSAYHAKLGVGGTVSRTGSTLGDALEVQLLPPAAHEIHVVDENGKPVAGLELPVNVAATRKDDYGWIALSALKSAHVRTSEAGIATLNWAPKALRMVDANIWNDDWKPDRRTSDDTQPGVTKQLVRRKYPVAGKLIVPEGVDATGILVTGTGFGTGSNLDIPAVRTAADGSFTLFVPAGHTYVLGVMDNQWAADPWTGDLRTDLPPDQVQVEMKLYPATPLAVRVTRGPNHEPVVNSYVSWRVEREFKFTNERGERGNARGAVRGWLRTDADGMIRTGVGRGEQELAISDGEWTEERTIDVTSADPINVEFYRPWIGKRKLTGRLLHDGKPLSPSSEATLLAWSNREQQTALQHETRLNQEGTFEVEFDSENAAILFFDPGQSLCGAVEIGPTDTDVAVKLQATASYEGTLVDGNEQPLADLEVFLSPEGHFRTAVVSQRTDEAGKFRFSSVPSDVSLTARLRSDVFGGPQRYITRSGRTFAPGETRADDLLHVRDPNDTSAFKAPEIALGESIRLACLDAKLNHMRALVIIEGDDSVQLRDVTSRLLDGDDTPDVLAYRVVSVSPERRAKEAAAIAERNWPVPEAGQAVLLVLDDAGEVTSSVTVSAAARDESLSQGRQLLASHRPPQRDAMQLLSAAQAEAKSSGRRLWVISGGPRCGPCFRLARWMDEQHALLDKDFVFVKVMGGLDRNAEVVAPLLPGAQSSGIPYYAIVEPDGKVLITSKGPQGNIGMPSEPEGIRHLLKMLDTTAKKLTAEEISTLEKSLAPSR